MAERDMPARWARAHKKAATVADRGFDEPLRTYLRWYLPAGTLLLVCLGYILSNLLLDFAWNTDFAIAMLLALFGTCVGGYAYANRRLKPRVTLARSTPLYGLEEGEQKSIRRQMLGKEPPVPEQLAVVRGVAIEQRYTLAKQFMVLLPFQVLLCTAQIVNFSARQGSVALWLYALWLFMCLWLIAYGAWQYRQMGAFLDDTRDEGEQDNARPS